MAKTQTFADKAAKAAREKGSKCHTCDTLLQPLLMIETGVNPKTNSYKFFQKRVSVCKCNEKEIFG
jgi:hypothetical protein